jgi:hypothetical protein
MVFFLRREDAKDGENEKTIRNNKDDENETKLFRVK